MVPADITTHNSWCWFLNLKMLWNLTTYNGLQSALLRGHETYKFTSSGSLPTPISKIQRRDATNKRLLWNENISSMTMKIKHFVIHIVKILKGNPPLKSWPYTLLNISIKLHWFSYVKFKITFLFVEYLKEIFCM